MSFTLGQRVRIVNYGHLVYQTNDEPRPANKTPYNTDDEGATYDIFPELIGRTGIVKRSFRNRVTGERQYHVEVSHCRVKYFYEDQLEAVENNE